LYFNQGEKRIESLLGFTCKNMHTAMMNSTISASSRNRILATTAAITSVHVSVLRRSLFLIQLCMFQLWDVYCTCKRGNQKQCIATTQHYAVAQ